MPNPDYSRAAMVKPQYSGPRLTGMTFRPGNWGGGDWFAPRAPTGAQMAFAARGGMAGLMGVGMGGRSIGPSGPQSRGGTALNPATQRALAGNRQQLGRIEQQMYAAEARGDYDEADRLQDILDQYGWLDRGGYEWFDPYEHMGADPYSGMGGGSRAREPIDPESFREIVRR